LEVMNLNDLRLGKLGRSSAAPAHNFEGFGGVELRGIFGSDRVISSLRADSAPELCWGIIPP
jgi:hypothetical protein